MSEIAELLKAFHFIIFFLCTLCSSILIREEFITVFSRKSIAGINLLKVLIIKTLSEENGYQIRNNKIQDTSLYVLTILGGVIPLLFFQLTDKQTFFGEEFYLGLFTGDNSWLWIFISLIFGEVIRAVYERETYRVSLKIPLLLLLLLTFYYTIQTFSVEQTVQIQKSYYFWKVKNLLILKNHFGLIFFGFLIYFEIKNPNESFSLISHIYMNTYLILFVYGFLGGYSLPRVLVQENVSSPIQVIILQSVFLFIKYVACLIVVWTYKYSLIKGSRRISNAS